jgi:hypothetical protein
MKDLTAINFPDSRMRRQTTDLCVRQAERAARLADACPHLFSSMNSMPFFQRAPNIFKRAEIGADVRMRIWVSLGRKNCSEQRPSASNMRKLSFLVCPIAPRVLTVAFAPPNLGTRHEGGH